MQKEIRVNILPEGNGIIVTRGNDALAFTKIGLPNHKLKDIVHKSGDMPINIISIGGTPKRKSLKRNFSGLLTVAKQENGFENFSLIRQLTIAKRKKRHAS